MLQRRLSQPFDCKLRPEHVETELSDFGSWLDRRFQLDQLATKIRERQPRTINEKASPTRASALPRERLEARPYWGGRKSLGRCRASKNLLRRAAAVFDPVQMMWETYISFYVPLNEMRDHLSLEKTFFSYLRTSVTLAIMGVTVAQIYVLQHSLEAERSGFGFHVVGKPLACACLVSAILVTLQGAIRFWVQQEAMLRGRIRSGGWNMLLIGGGFVLGITILFALFVALDIHVESRRP